MLSDLEYKLVKEYYNKNDIPEKYINLTYQFRYGKNSLIYSIDSFSQLFNTKQITKKQIGKLIDLMFEYSSKFSEFGKFTQENIFGNNEQASNKIQSTGTMGGRNENNSKRTRIKRQSEIA